MTDPTALTAAATAAAATGLSELAAEAWDSQMAAHPVYATALGDRRFDDRLRPNGPGALEADAARLRALLDRAEAIDSTALDDRDRITAAALVDFLRSEHDLVAAGMDAWSVDPLDGPQVAYLNVPSFTPVRTVEEGDALVARWREIGPWVDRLVATTRDSMTRGIAAPHALVRSVLAELDDLLARPVDDWPLLAPIHDAPDDWPTDRREAYAAAIRGAVADGIRPAFARYRAFLADQLAGVARDDDHPGLSHLPGGAEAYASLVRGHTTLEIAPDEVHRIGLAETERIDAEFRELGGRQLGTSDLATILARLRSDPALYFSTPAEVHAVAEASLARATAAIGGWFGRLPQAPCVVVEMAPHEAKYSTIAYYRQPAADGSRPGSYYINTSEP